MTPGVIPNAESSRKAKRSGGIRRTTVAAATYLAKIRFTSPGLGVR